MTMTEPEAQAAFDDGQAATHQRSVDPRLFDFTDVAKVPATVMDVVLAGSPRRSQPGPPPVTPTILSILPATAASGAQVALTITGTGFTPTSVVHVAGAVNADLPHTYVSPTSITLNWTPPAPGNTPFTVKNGSLTSAPFGWTAT